MARGRNLLRSGMLAVLLAALADASPAAAQAPTPEGAFASGPRGLLAPRRETMLSSQIAGRINHLAVTEGDPFKQGQTLVSLDCTLHQKKLEVAKAELDGAAKTLDAHRRLDTLGSSSRLDLVHAEAVMAKASAEMAVIQATLSFCSIPAPFNGRVAGRPAHPFQYVDAGAPLLEIIDDGAFELQVIVPSRWLAWLKVGRAFSIRMDETGKTYPAKVTKLGARIDPASQSIKVFGEIDGRFPELLAGMSGVTDLADR